MGEGWGRVEEGRDEYDKYDCIEGCIEWEGREDNEREGSRWKDGPRVGWLEAPREEGRVKEREGNETKETKNGKKGREEGMGGREVGSRRGGGEEGGGIGGINSKEGEDKGDSQGRDGCQPASKCIVHDVA